MDGGGDAISPPISPPADYLPRQFIYRAALSAEVIDIGYDYRMMPTRAISPPPQLPHRRCPALYRAIMNTTRAPAMLIADGGHLKFKRSR